jgi:pilus assembly protein CpaF
MSEIQLTADEKRLQDLRLLIYNVMMTRIDASAILSMSKEDLLKEVEQFVFDYSDEQNIQLSSREQTQVAQSIVDDMIGLGPLETLLSDDAVTDIMVNGANDIYIEKMGKLQKTAVFFRDEEHTFQIAQRIANGVGRRIDESSPTVDARLMDGSRVNIIVPPIALSGTTISIRKFSKRKIDFSMMVAQNNMSQEIADFLEIAALCRLNIIVSGGTGAGKTTVLNALSNLIDDGDRIVTIEDAAELKITKPHIVRLETRPANTEGTGAVSIRTLLKNSLRMRPDRIIVGEVRGEETVDMLQAMNTGHDGSLSTIHANRAVDALLRLENMITLSDAGIPSKVIRAQISGGLDLIIQVERMHDGKRRIREIIEVNDLVGETIQTKTLFSFEFEREDEERRIHGTYRVHHVVPKFVDKAKYFGLDEKLKKIMGI